MELKMQKSIIELAREFKNIYKTGIRQNYDIGEISSNDITYDDKSMSNIDYFFNNLNGSKEIHVGSPLNLIFDIKKNNYFKKGWNNIKDIDSLLFFGIQNETFFAQSLATLEIFCLISGDSEVYFIAETFNDFLGYINGILKISITFLEKNDQDENYYILEDEDFINEVKRFTDQTSLKIDKKNIFDIFFF